MDEKTYVRDRLDQQIAWYDTKSQTNQSWFKRLQIALVVCGTLIPFLTVLDSVVSVRAALINAALGTAVAIISGVLGLFKLQEHWIDYRSTCESLRHEKYLFLTRTEPYDSDDPFHLLVSRVEAQISKENTNWAQFVTGPSEPGC